MFYLNSSIHVALAVTALTIVSGMHLDISLDWSLLFFVFFGAITGYNFIKYAGIAKLHHRSLAKNLKLIQVFSFLCFLALVYFAFQVNFRVLLIAAFLALLTLLYALPFLGERNLRTIGGIKIYIIAFIWAGVSVVLLPVEEGVTIGKNVVLEFIQRFLFVLVLLIPFEIRDLKYDKANLKTLPQNMGVKGSKAVGVILLVLIILLEFFKETEIDERIDLVIISVVTGWLMLKAKEDQPALYSSFWVEGVPLLWLIILLVLENAF